MDPTRDISDYTPTIEYWVRNFVHSMDSGPIAGDRSGEEPLGVKIIFDGYGDLEFYNDNDEYRYTEGGDTNMESYAIFIHKDSAQEDFVFPEHELTPWCLIHRPKEEVCIYAWYDVENDTWDILPLEERVEDTDLTIEQVMGILETLNERYF
jgi:hypothetical protein